MALEGQEGDHEGDCAGRGRAQREAGGEVHEQNPQENVGHEPEAPPGHRGGGDARVGTGEEPPAVGWSAAREVYDELGVHTEGDAEEADCEFFAAARVLHVPEGAARSTVWDYATEFEGAGGITDCDYATEFEGAYVSIIELLNIFSAVLDAQLKGFDR